MQALEAFLLDCRLRRLSHRTIETYLLRITPAIKFAEPGDHRLAFVEWLDTYKNARTRHQAFRCVKTYIRWCASKDICPDWISGMRLKFSDAPIPKPLCREEVNAILAAIPIKSKRKELALVGKRDHALYLLLYLTGARRDAIRLAKWSDVSLAAMEIRIKTKGDKEFLLPLNTEAARELNTWSLHCPSKEWIFPSVRRPGKPICENYVSRALPRYAQKANIGRRVWVHLLRHSHAGALAKAGIPAEVIQIALGHSSITTTIKYIHKLGAAERVRNAINQVFG